MAPWRLHVGGHVGGAVGVLAELQLPAGGAEGRSVGRRRPAGFGRSAPHRPEPAVAAGSRGEPAPLLSRAALVQLPRDSRWHTAAPPGGCRGSLTHTNIFFSAGRGCRSCSACVKPAKRFERSSSFVAAASPSALRETWWGGGGQGMREQAHALE